jgi:hypothetical protein
MVLPCGHDVSELQSVSCRICELFVTRPEYAKLFRSQLIQRVKTVIKQPCIYLGELINPKPDCGCGAHHKCTMYGECVVSGKGAGKWQVCTQCESYRGA